ncbi:hypothetical protein [Halococcus hamelinensis]|uniref:Uncharacterized protein n=1 Tax=Halococcus hamelinensis 100A6 TaxID=1132509 RepID=M0M0L2_9EURY|nr:hypothetical protein [Halococcus hamelinensis]EMA37915.1 hypothetical protein C447_10780 [Halococcus hamelinensis 100A6]
MALLDILVVLVVATLVGGLGIYAVVRLLVDDAIEPIDGLVLALVGAAAWGAVSLFLASTPVLGPVLALLVWVVLVEVRYPCGWPAASALGFVVWLPSVGLLYVLGTFGVVSFAAVGVPVVYFGG